MRVFKRRNGTDDGVAPPASGPASEGEVKLVDAEGNEVGRVVGPQPKPALERMVADVVDRFRLRTG